LISLKSYLQSTTDYFQAFEEENCNACTAQCTTNSPSTAPVEENGRQRRRHLGENKFYDIVPDCATCVDQCDKLKNMEVNGFIDATNFLECTLIYSPEDDNAAALYAGPICASSGTKIKIGVFTDENCQTLDEAKEVDDFLVINGISMSLSNYFLRKTYTDTCISCKEPMVQNENPDGDATEDSDVVVEICEQLYDEAKKCETPHGFADGVQQMADEDAVCEYIATLKNDIPIQSDFPMAFQMPSDAPSDILSDAPTSDVGVLSSAQCEDNHQCALLNLTGACCPTVNDWTLRCCGEPDIPIYQSCLNHSKCAAYDLEEACCPTADGKWLDCCDTIPDECQVPGKCPVYSTTQYQLDLAAAGKTASNAASIIVVGATALVAMVAVMAM
jgi:hypothetical protein